MEIKRISDLFWGGGANLFFLSIVLSVVTGLCYALLVPFVMYSIASISVVTQGLEITNYNFFRSPSSDLAKLFLLTITTIIIIKSASHVSAVYIAQKASVKHRINLYKRINLISYSDLERIGHAKLINLINIDIPHLTSAAAALPSIWIGLITIVGTLSYLMYLNSKVFFFVLICLLVAVITYQVPMLFALRYLRRSRDYYDQVQDGVNGLINGAKELKLDSVKSLQYINEELILPENQAFNHDIRGKAIAIFAEVYGEIVSFLVVGITIFHLPYIYNISQSELFGIVIALLYLAGPVGIVLNAFNALQLGKVALYKVKEFQNVLVEEGTGFNESLHANCDVYSLRNIRYRYENGGNSFTIFDISVEFKRGEITFIVGGNGSGKSTLSKILSLHYHPCNGELLIDGNNIIRSNVNTYRNLISVIYSDFFIFPRLYSDFNIATLHKYLGRLDLEDKVKITNSRFDTVKLSDGQRKRLALLSVLLDDRPICIFDEWAADQDPHFKAIFYEEILMDLKAQGKMIIVISHDDRYFHCADQLIELEGGTIRK